MSLEIEVRSSGPGPRRRFIVNTRWMPVSAWIDASKAMGKLWTRIDVTRRGHLRWCADGVAIHIRRRSS